MEGKKHQDIAFSGGVSKLDPLYAFGGQRSNLKAVFNDLISINPDYFETPIAEIISHAASHLLNFFRQKSLLAKEKTFSQILFFNLRNF